MGAALERPDPDAIPEAPGCYLFRDADGRVLYVGKAKSLRQRLSAYFGSAEGLHPRTRAMLEAARSVEWIVVDTEVESLHLEYTLIQRHRPRYNVKYRDDKSYPYLVLTTSEEVPRARVARRPPRRTGPRPEPDRLFGPYAHAHAIRETLDLLLRVFPVRTCSDATYERCARTGRACLYYDIGRCSAPCIGAISVADHRRLVDGLADFLEGRTRPVLDALEREMRDAAARMEFERAAVLRDKLTAARRALERQQVVLDRPEDLDAIALAEDAVATVIGVFHVRGGRVVGRRSTVAEDTDSTDLGELLRGFLVDLYATPGRAIPPLVLVPEPPADQPALEALLSERRGTRVRIHVPRRGSKRALLELVARDAAVALQAHRTRRAADLNARSEALRALQEVLELPTAPLRIECIDISHLGGREVVGSLVVFEDGAPRRDQYRRFKLSVDRNDDYAAIAEVVARRFRRWMRERELPPERRRFAYPPQLVLIDGGPGQLHAALEAVADLDVGGARFAALAKRLEELYLPGRREPIRLPRGHPALYLLQHVRDEAHRWALRYQQLRRRRTVRHSVLDDVPGIGPARRRALLERFGSVRAIAAASVEELAAVPGISRTLARAVHDHLSGTEA